MSVKVVQFITETNIGGAEKALARLLAHLDRDRFAVTVACLFGGDGAVANEIRAMNIPLIDLGMTARWRWDAFWRLYHFLRREQPTILHTWMFHANVPGRLLGRLAGVPILISSERTMGQESRLRCILNRVTAPLADRITCVSQQVADFASHAIGIPKNKLIVIRNGVPLQSFRPGDGAEVRDELGIPHSALVVGTVGRLQPVKGVSYLLEAFAHIASDHPESVMLSVGDGPQRAQLEEMAQQIGVFGRVRFLGARSDVPRLLQAMDVFALPSIREGMPNAVLEAMATGLPTVAAAVGGTPEVVVDGVTGLLVAPRDPLALAEAITRLLNNSELRHQMGQAGQKRVSENFSVERMVEQTQNLYQHLLDQKGL